MNSFLFSRSTFGVARVFMALCVFFCHVFESFNNFGFLFVGVFFFMSGYGMEKSDFRLRSLTRVVPYIVYFVFFSFIYYLFYQVFPYPTSWFLVVYFLVMLLYRFFSRNIYLFLLSLILLAYFFDVLEFNFVWYASYGAFLFGVFFARNQSSFLLKYLLYLFPLSLLIFAKCVPALWCILPLFVWFVLHLSSLKCFRPIAWLGQYTFFFYCVHCFFLGLFEVTWTLGGSPSLFGVLAAFLCACVVSWLLNDYIFNYSRIK